MVSAHCRATVVEAGAGYSETWDYDFGDVWYFRSNEGHMVQGLADGCTYLAGQCPKTSQGVHIFADMHVCIGPLQAQLSMRMLCFHLRNMQHAGRGTILKMLSCHFDPDHSPPLKISFQ